MKVTRTKIVFIIIVIQLLGLYMLYNHMIKPPMDMANKDVAYRVDASHIYSEYQKDQQAFEKKYLNKIISLTGTITAVEDSLIMLNNTVVCIVDMTYANLKKNQAVKIKGKYIGYDELFDNLKISECLIEAL